MVWWKQWLRRDQKINRSTGLARGAGSSASKAVNAQKKISQVTRGVVNQQGDGSEVKQLSVRYKRS